MSDRDLAEATGNNLGCPQLVATLQDSYQCKRDN